MWTIAAIGECMLELSNPTGTALRRDMPLNFSFGGDTLNTAVYLSRLGVNCAYVTALGDDPYSQWMQAEWQSEGVNTDLVATMAQRTPGLYMIQTDSAGERSFYYWRKDAPARELFADPDRATALMDRLRQFDVLYLSGVTLSLYDSASLARLFDFFQSYRNGGGRIVFDGNYRPKGWDSAQQACEVYERIYQLSAIALPTFDDEKMLFHDASAEHTADRLRALGVEEVAVKQGADGVLVCTESLRQWVPTLPVERVVDSTAAGDSFNGGYLAARARGKSALDAAAVAHKLAGTVIQHAGAIIPLAQMPELALSETAVKGGAVH